MGGTFPPLPYCACNGLSIDRLLYLSGKLEDLVPMSNLRVRVSVYAHLTQPLKLVPLEYTTVCLQSLAPHDCLRTIKVTLFLFWF